ncbi:MerR family DNA-binding transcriptional regulator [Saccharibacillus endophyticus]
MRQKHPRTDSIGEFAAIVGIPASKLRYYEKENPHP